jgi:hypothetical protein
MKRTLMWLVPAAAALMAAAPAFRVDAAPQNGTATTATLFACGGPEVLTLTLRLEGDKVEIAERTDWDAGRSEGMPAGMVPTFRTTDDCKPIDGGTRLLVTSSSGGLAIVERATGKTEFYATVPNAHSAEVLPGGRVVAAASTSPTGNRLIVFDRQKSDVEVFTTPLVSAHGTQWVEGERTLWALGLLELQAYELVDWEGSTPSLKLRDTFKLPSRGGHDLSPVPGHLDVHRHHRARGADLRSHDPSVRAASRARRARERQERDHPPEDGPDGVHAGRPARLVDLHGALPRSGSHPEVFERSPLQGPVGTGERC